MEKNDTYWVAGTPLLDQLVFKNVPDAQSRLAQLRAGSVQMIDGIDPKDVKQAQGFPNAYVFTSKPVNLYEIFQINTKRAPFSDKRGARRSTPSTAGRSSRTSGTATPA